MSLVDSHIFFVQSGEIIKLPEFLSRQRRVAVVGGSGGGMVSLAAKREADLLITGGVPHHEALEAESLGLALIDGGHFHTEKVALKLFANHLRDTFIEQKLDVILEVYNGERDPHGPSCLVFKDLK